MQMTPDRVEQYLLMLDFLADIISPDGYGHEMPPEVIRRASRILKQAPAEVVIPPALLHSEPVVPP